jgi:hypothetical protein
MFAGILPVNRRTDVGGWRLLSQSPETGHRARIGRFSLSLWQFFPAEIIRKASDLLKHWVLPMSVREMGTPEFVDWQSKRSSSHPDLGEHMGEQRTPQKAVTSGLLMGGEHSPMASAVVGDRRRAVRGSGVKHDVGR